MFQAAQQAAKGELLCQLNLGSCFIFLVFNDIIIIIIIIIITTTTIIIIIIY